MKGAPAAGTHACDGCGAHVEYVPGTVTLRCPYCQHETQLVESTATVHEHDIAELATREPSAVATHVLTCTKCGATCDSETVASRCQFCGSPVVVSPDATVQLPPDAVLPFEVDRAAVRTGLRTWVATRRFAPKGFKMVADAESLVGTYVPTWAYDAQTTSDYTGERGEHYWDTEIYSTTDANGQTQTHTRQVMKTRWWPAEGTVSRAFDDVTVPATGRFGDVALSKLGPWPWSQAVAFQPEYLAGFSALRYDVEPRQGLAVAQDQMAKAIRRACRDDIGGDEQRVHRVSTSYADVRFKLLLVPLWVVCYVYAGKSWQIVMNGRTGEIHGERPWAKGKIALTVLAVVAVVAAIVWAIAASRRGAS